MSSNCQKDKQNGGTRRRTRSHSPLPTPRVLDDDRSPVPAAKKTRTSPRNSNYCTDFNGLPAHMFCDGCVCYEDSTKRKPRDKMLSREMQCFKAWKREEKDVPLIMMAHWKAIRSFMSSTLNIDPNSMQEEAGLVALTTTTTLATPSPQVTATRNINLWTQTITSEGKSFKFKLPTTHKIMHKSYIQALENDRDTLKRVRKKTQASSYSTTSMYAQVLWSLAMTAVPAMALSAAQYFIPLVIRAFFYDTGLFTYKTFRVAKFAKAFPSDWLLRKYNWFQATRDTLLLGHRLRDKKIYLSCDKGNKKGVDHMIKILSSWNTDGDNAPRVEIRILDIDACGGSNTEAAAGINASVNKLKANGNEATHLLSGQTTDSGGGGKLEGLAEDLHQLGNVCVPQGEYLIGNCCLHALQLQLGNAIKKTFGEGALDKVNAMQMLHSVYRLQESIDLDEWRYILCKSSQFVCEYDPSIVDTMVPSNVQEEHQLAFYKKYNKVLAFHADFKKQLVDFDSPYKDTVLSKMTAPTLTRWWTVGAGSSYMFDYYLVLFHACQTVINLYKSDRTPNMIASDLFNLMTDQENFIDLTLIRCFHKAYINPHFDWFQSSKELSEALGFQSHQVATRYFLMHRDLEHIMSGKSMDQYLAAVNNWKGDGDTIEDQNRHRKKLSVFVNEAFDSLNKHFPRWLNQTLLPAALLAEAPLAKVVAAAMLGEAMPSFESDASVDNRERITGRIDFKPNAHSKINRPIDLLKYDKFIREHMQKESQYSPQAIEAARSVLDSIDLRSFDYTDTNSGELRYHMHSTYLPFACHTQFVETGVKEAKLTASTDRSEQHRSWIAIIRSASPLGKSKDEDDNASFNANKIMSLIESAKQRSKPHVDWIEDQSDDNEYDQRFNVVRHALRQGHFKTERIDLKRDAVDNQGAVYKRQNAAQSKSKQQHMTMAVTGLIPYSKVTQKRNMKDIVVEIKFRQQQLRYASPIPQSIALRKLLLQRLEAIRLIEDDNFPTEQAYGNKAFSVLSGAPFKLSD